MNIKYRFSRSSPIRGAVPPTPPPGWPLPSVGDIISVPEESFGYLAVRVVSIVWDYAVPEAIIYVKQVMVYGGEEV